MGKHSHKDRDGSPDRSRDRRSRSKHKSSRNRHPSRSPDRSINISRSTQESGDKNHRSRSITKERSKSRSLSTRDEVYISGNLRKVPHTLSKPSDSPNAKEQFVYRSPLQRVYQSKSATEEGEISDSSEKTYPTRDASNNDRSSACFSFGDISYIAKDPQFDHERQDATRPQHELSSCSFVTKKDTDHDKELDDIISEGKQKVVKGPPLHAKSQEIVDNWFGQDCDTDYIKKLKDCYAEPENTDQLSGKDMNSEIYRTLPEPKRTNDFWLKSVQTNVCTSAIANFRAIDLLLENKKDIRPDLLSTLCKHVSSAAKLTAKASSDITVMETTNKVQNSASI